MIPGQKQLIQRVLQKVNLERVLRWEVKSIGFGHHKHMSYIQNGPFWATYHDQGRGVVLAISPYLKKCITTSRRDPSTCCVWITLLFQERLLGFCSIYAPNSSSKHTQICTRLESSLTYVEWILGGDFNMVEWDIDREGGVSCVISGQRNKHGLCVRPLFKFLYPTRERNHKTNTLLGSIN